MSLIVSGSNFELIPAGVYVARCYRLVDLGTQTFEYSGQTKHQRQVQVSWELLQDDDGDEIRMEDGRPFSISKKYTASFHEKSSLYKDISRWRVKALSDEEKLSFDLSSLLNSYCKIQVKHVESNGKTYPNVDTIMYTKKTPKGENPVVIFDIEHPDLAVFEGMSDWMKDQIQKAPEWQVAKEVAEVMAD